MIRGCCFNGAVPGFAFSFWTEDEVLSPMTWAKSYMDESFRCGEHWVKNELRLQQPLCLYSDSVPVYGALNEHKKVFFVYTTKSRLFTRKILIALLEMICYNINTRVSNFRSVDPDHWSISRVKTIASWSSIFGIEQARDQLAAYVESPFHKNFYRNYRDIVHGFMGRNNLDVSTAMEINAPFAELSHQACALLDLPRMFPSPDARQSRR